MMQFSFAVHAIALAGLSIVLSGCGSAGTTTTTPPGFEHVRWWKDKHYSLTGSDGLVGGPNGTVFLTGDDGLSALNPNSGILKWKLESAVIGTPLGRPAVGPDGSLYVLTFGTNYSRSVVCVSSDGTRRWIQDFNKSADWCQQDDNVPNSVVLGSDGTVFVSECLGRDDRHTWGTAALFALDGNDGSIKWQSPIDSSSETDDVLKPSPIIASDDTIFLADHFGNVFAMRGADGSAIWNASLLRLYTGNAGLPSMGAEGTVLICTGEGLFALDGKNGSVKWQQEDACFGSQGFGATAGSDGTVYVRSSRPSGWATAEAKLHALNGDDGSIKWTKEFANDELECDGEACSLTMAAVSAPDRRGLSMVYVAFGTTVWALRADDGEGMWYSEHSSHTDNDNFRHFPPVISADGYTVFVSFTNTLYAFRADDPYPWASLV